MPSGQGLVDRAVRHLSEKYDFVLVPKDDPDWKGPWDCAEFISWLVYQEAGVLYGCKDNRSDPHTADAYTGYWRRDATSLPISVPAKQAAATPGGVLLRFPPAPGTMGHIALSDGKGGTIEAMGKAYGVRRGRVDGRKWDAGVLIPEIQYGDAAAPRDFTPPGPLYYPEAPGMHEAVVRRIQAALRAKGFDPGKIDGDYGPDTARAVSAFQTSVGIVADGEVGKDTAARLGISLDPAVAAVSAARQDKPGDAMGPLIPIALNVLPIILQALAGDKTGAIAASVSKAVADAAGTQDPDVARQKLNADPAAERALQIRLAEIAADQESKRQEAQLLLIREANARDADERKDDLARLGEELRDVGDARRSALEWAKLDGPQKWGPLAISLLVILGFFVNLGWLTVMGGPQMNVAATAPEMQKSADLHYQSLFQLINLTLGALVAAFTTVVTFWLGSSQGSRIKDVAGVNQQVEQTRQAAELMKSAQSTIEATQSKALTIEAARASLAPERASAPAAPAKKFSNFQRCVDIVLAREGGFVDHPDDRGGATNFGITIGTLSKWMQDRVGRPADVEDVKSLTRETACEIYRTRYWNVCRCDDLPPGVDLVVFDMAVNMGPGRAAKILQQVVGAEADGSIGDATLAATKAMRPADVVVKTTERRLQFYRGLDNWDAFGRGWTNRANDVEQAALVMTRDNPAA
ncbi:glycosyl hydrolase 108 family protein [Methylocella sp.]|uniref:glycosyl hydrolase 108 family protein n=1 Tax=Methylocella sp. TaxID=1978226 RepID=UPI0037847A06